MAQRSAVLAVFCIMFGALFCAIIANFRTQIAECSGINTFARHERRRHTACIGAISIQTYAVSHHCHVVFLKAG
ncbi:hypothetical protein CF98_07890 [Halopseudomonas bauzanensis]|nr:hypothetical protein CF98_07890 [Halopseudomonas bauzanensis]